MKKQFVTYEIALKLKELGFDELCFGWWCWINGSIANFYDYKISNSQLIELNNHKNNCAAPLWQQAIDFLREKYLLHIEIQSPDYPNETNFNWTIHKVNFFGGFGDGSNSDYFICREQAILKAIELCQKEK